MLAASIESRHPTYEHIILRFFQVRSEFLSSKSMVRIAVEKTHLLSNGLSAIDEVLFDKRNLLMDQLNASVMV